MSDLVQEADLRLVDQHAEWHMRRVLIDFARRRQRHKRGHYAEAEQAGRDALALASKRRGEAGLSRAAVLRGLAEVLSLRGANEEAERLMKEAGALDRRLAGERSAAVANDLNTLAMIHYRRGDYGEARGKSGRLESAKRHTITSLCTSERP